MLIRALVEELQVQESACATHQGLPLTGQHLPEVWGAGCHDSSVKGEELLTDHESKVAVGRLGLTATAGSLQQYIGLEPHV